MRCFALNAASPEIALTTSWHSSNTPRTAMLKMFASGREYICAAWKALMRPYGESMKTRMFFLPRSAYSAEEPVSPEVLEGERGPVGEAEEIQIGLELPHRRDVLAAEQLFRVSRGYQTLQVVRGNVVGEFRQDRERELRVAHAAHRGKIGGSELRKLLRQEQAAVRREAFEQDPGERLRLRPAASADVAHGFSNRDQGRASESRSLQLFQPD